MDFTDIILLQSIIKRKIFGKGNNFNKGEYYRINRFIYYQRVLSL